MRLRVYPMTAVLLLLNGVVTTGTDESAVRKLMPETAATRKISAGRIDVEKLRQAIIKESSQ